MTGKAEAAFIKAFLNLARCKSATDISVTEVAEASCLTRRTFYRHYAGIGDLAHSAMNSLGRGFASGLSLTGSTNTPAPPARPARLMPEAYALAIFGFWEKELALLKNIQRSQDAIALLSAWMEGAGAAVHGVNLESAMNNVSARYLTKFMTGGLAAALLEWVEDERRPAAADMAHIVSLPFRA